MCLLCSRVDCRSGCIVIMHVLVYACSKCSRASSVQQFADCAMIATGSTVVLNALCSCAQLLMQCTICKLKQHSAVEMPKNTSLVYTSDGFDSSQYAGVHMLHITQQRGYSLTQQQSGLECFMHP
jgi:hypothetical protein